LKKIWVFIIRFVYYQFRTWVTKPDLLIRDSSFPKVAHRRPYPVACRGERQTGRRPWASKGRKAYKEWNCKY